MLFVLILVVQTESRSVTLTRWMGTGYCTDGYGVVECSCCKGTGCNVSFPPEYTWSSSCSERSDWRNYCSKKVSSCPSPSNDGSIYGVNTATCYPDGANVSFPADICLSYSGYYFQVHCAQDDSWTAQLGPSCDNFALTFYGTGPQTCVPFGQTNPAMSVRIDCGAGQNAVAESLEVDLHAVKKKIALTATAIILPILSVCVMAYCIYAYCCRPIDSSYSTADSVLSNSYSRVQSYTVNK